MRNIVALVMALTGCSPEGRSPLPISQPVDTAYMDSCSPQVGMALSSPWQRDGKTVFYSDLTDATIDVAVVIDACDEEFSSTTLVLDGQYVLDPVTQTRGHVISLPMEQNDGVWSPMETLSAFMLGNGTYDVRVIVEEYGAPLPGPTPGHLLTESYGINLAYDATGDAFGVYQVVDETVTLLGSLASAPAETIEGMLIGMPGTMWYDDRFLHGGDVVSGSLRNETCSQSNDGVYVASNEKGDLCPLPQTRATEDWCLSIGTLPAEEYRTVTVAVADGTGAFIGGMYSDGETSTLTNGVDSVSITPALDADRFVLCRLTDKTQRSE
jgi:hypothetical protein